MKTCLLTLFWIAAALSPAWAYQKEGGGCGAGDCRDCHAINKEEVSTLLKGKVDAVLDVKRSEVPGLWDVEALFEGKKVPLYLDFSKSYIISGTVIKLSNDENVTNRSLVNMNRVDLAKIPLADAIVIGNPAAANKIIVFDDPECSYCNQLHAEMNKVANAHPDISFFVKMYPLAMHPNAKYKARAIVCVKLKGDNSRAEAMLAASLAGNALPAPDCATDQVDKNIALAKELYIMSTPTLIMPDGQTIPGFKEADAIVAALQAAKK